MLDYATFLQKKSVTVPECGFESHEVNPKLFHWQAVKNCESVVTDGQMSMEEMLGESPC